MKITRLVMALAVGAALIAVLERDSFATEEDHVHDAGAKCSWQADLAPRFLPGSSRIDDDDGVITTDVFGNTVRRRFWNLQLQPAYQYGYAYAWDAWFGNAVVSKSGAASSEYGVLKQGDCCQPARSVKPLAAVAFKLRATSDGSDASGRAEGASRVFGSNTGMTVTGADGVTTDSDDDGATVSIPIGGGSVQITLGFGSSDESTASVASSTSGSWINAPDEEYLIDTNLMVKAAADGVPLFYPTLSEEGSGRLYDHSVHMRTEVTCTHCGQAMRDTITIDDANLGVVESTRQ